MSRLLTLTRAARLAGVARGALQKKIISGELRTFEGMVAPVDLLRAYPQIRMDDNTVMERFTQIKDSAFSLRVRERIMPDPDVLMARLSELGKELAELKSQLGRYQHVIEHLDDRLAGMQRNDAGLQAAFDALRSWMRNELEPDATPSGDTHALAIKDTLLRLMVAQVRLLPSGREFFVEGSDTVLEAALRAGVSMEYGCSDGSCGLCKARIVSGRTQQVRAPGFALTPEDLAGGCALLCSHVALTDLVIEAKQDNVQTIPQQQLTARVKTIEYPVQDMAVVQLQSPKSRRLRFLSGQYVRLDLGNGVVAKYPVASCPCDERNLQFHVHRIATNKFSEYVFTCLKNADVVSIEGPVGEFVLAQDTHRPLLFITADDGFAPIKSLIEHAMALDVAEVMHLYWFSLRTHGHYLNNLCRAWADALDNFYYTPAVLPGTNGDWTGSLAAQLTTLAREHPDLQAFDVYVAGPLAFVEFVRGFLLDHGLPETQLHADRTREDSLMEYAAP